MLCVCFIVFAFRVPQNYHSSSSEASDELQLSREALHILDKNRYRVPLRIKASIGLKRTRLQFPHEREGTAGIHAKAVDLLDGCREKTGIHGREGFVK